MEVKLRKDKLEEWKQKKIEEKKIEEKKKKTQIKRQNSISHMKPPKTAREHHTKSSLTNQVQEQITLQLKQDQQNLGELKKRKRWQPTSDPFNPQKQPKISSKVEDRIDILWQNFMLFKIVPCDQLEKCFQFAFEKERVISFRQTTPKALNARGEELLKSAKIWIL